MTHMECLVVSRSNDKSNECGEVKQRGSETLVGAQGVKALSEMCG